MADQYLTQAEASVYSDAISVLSEVRANAFLAAASAQVDYYCGRRFDTDIDPLPGDVAMAVAIWAEELSNGANAGREKSSERIGDYSVSYETTGAAVSVAYPCPMVVASLLGPYRNIRIG